MIDRISLFGLDFQAATSVEIIVSDVLDRKECDEDRIPLMITPNVDQIVKLEKEENCQLKSQLARSQWILPDGQPIVALSKLKHKVDGLPARLTGSDFFPAIWKELKLRQNEVYFALSDDLLGKKFVSERLRTRFYAPPYFQLTDVQTYEEVVARIVEDLIKIPVDYFFIGLGFPKQEQISLAVFERLRLKGKSLPKTFLLGASYEFYHGTKKRAPKIWQKLGIEFVYRLFSEPRRMAKRYLIDDVSFLPLAIKELKKR